MSFLRQIGLPLGLLAFSLAGPAQAASYTEAADGDLSDAFNNPTPFVLEAGNNLLTGTVGTSSSDYSDFFRLVLSPDLDLTNIFLVSYAPGPGNSSTAINHCLVNNSCGDGGGDYSVTTSLTNGKVGNDLLPSLSSRSTYVFRLGEGAGPASYSLNFVAASSVPEPSTVALFGIGLLAVAGARRRRVGSTTKS